MASPNDVLGFSAQYAHISHEAGLKYPYELAFEAFKKYQITPWENIQPDLQYILHPGGHLDDAIVLTLRWEIQF
jgi:carbohydrate-selective porin OprB